MTLTTIAAMFSAMVALAVIPDASALAVTARSISFGFKHGVILATAIAALSCTKLAYAFMADKSRVLFKSSKAKKRINLISGGAMIATGLFLALHA